jgi:hypothetical protein
VALTNSDQLSARFSLGTGDLLSSTVARAFVNAFVTGSIRTHHEAPHHYVFYGMDREALHRDSLFLRAPAFEGAQVAYSWRQLEPRENEYDFTMIREDLAWLRAHGKRLWIQLQDVSFANGHIPVPQYLVSEPQYSGGIARQYRIEGDDESTAVPQGWAMRRWDPAVQERFYRLLDRLGREFDGFVEGINLAETSVTFGTTGRLFPAGFSFPAYRDGVIANMKALKLAFPKSIALVYANFMPGEWRPTDDRGYLAAVYRAARESGVGVGGPDLMPHRRGQLHGSYPLIRESSAIVPTALAVQDGNSDEINPVTGIRVTASELLEYATSALRLHYVFWGIEEPFYSAQVVPLVSR